MIRGYTCRHRLIEGYLNYTVEMGSAAMIYITVFVKTGSAIQKLIDGTRRHTDSKVIS
jgi:hypothetical protein